MLADVLIESGFVGSLVLNLYIRRIILSTHEHLNEDYLVTKSLLAA